MLTTKRYEYLAFDRIQEHPGIRNHRPINRAKVEHYETDILKNGLLEPLIVWERNPDEFFLVGGFHRLEAIRGIRNKNPGYFDHVDVRVVAGDLDEITALNLKLNADRVDAKITDYFDVVIYLNNANWSRERIAEFLDRSVSWVDDIIRFVPPMPEAVRTLLDQGKLSWNRAKTVCRTILEAPPGLENDVRDRELAALREDSRSTGRAVQRRPLTLSRARKRLADRLRNDGRQTYVVGARDLLSLIVLLEGRHHNEEHLDIVREKFPGLLEEEA